MGLSATIDRDDDLTFLIKHAIGDTYFIADREKMVKQGLLIKPDFRPIFMKRKKFYNENGNTTNSAQFYRELINEFKEDEQVVKFISELAFFHQKNGDQILMIIKEKKYSEKFYEMLLKRLAFTKEQIAEFQKKADFLNEQKREKILKRKIQKEKEKTIPEINIISDKYKINKIKKNNCMTSNNYRTIKNNLNSVKVNDDEFDKIEWYELPEVETASRIAWILGKTSKKRRKIIIEQAKRKEIDIIITTKLFDKAIKQMWHFAVM